LKKVFEVYGEIVSVKVVKNKFSGDEYSLGCGYVCFNDTENARKVIQQFLTIRL
jgi:RNA recognition motif-containing protein